MADRLILVTGATGKQGGATLRHLAKRGGFKLRALTRNPDGDAARAVAALGAEVVAGDLDDEAVVARAVDGAWGVHSVQTWQGGVEKEEQQGKRLSRLARASGVQRFVYSSVGGANQKTGISHFDSKARIEDEVRAAGFPSHTILRPVYFMENLFMPWTLQGDKLIVPLRPETKMQMIASDDIGAFAAKALADDDMKGAELEIAGDEVTMPAAAAMLSEVLGKPITHVSPPLDEVRKRSADLATMFQWFESAGYSADIAGLQRRFGIRAQTLKQWLSARKA
jgi:uncharacterized protein YbjT (DUF2867 family)